MLRLLGCCMGLMISIDACSMCDLREFRDDCELTVSSVPRAKTSSLIRCGHVYGYISSADYDTLLHYQRVHMNLSLSINNAFVTAHCIPIER